MQMSIINAIINALNIVPIPGFWPNGIHKIKTAILIKNVIVPILKFTFKEIPCAKTLHGEAPVNETINNPSPNPNSVNPKHKKKNVKNLGLKLYGSLELQFTFGIFFIFKNILVSYFYY